MFWDSANKLNRVCVCARVCQCEAVGFTSARVRVHVLVCWSLLVCNMYFMYSIFCLVHQLPCSFIPQKGRKGK